MSEKETDFIDKRAAEAASGGDHGAASSIAHEIANQLNDFSAGRIHPLEENMAKKILINDSSFYALSDKDRKEAITNAGNSLDAMVKGDIPKLRERLKELGVSTAELDKVEKNLTAKVEQAKPLQDAILTGDAQAMQKLLKSMDPKQLAEVAELIQKHFDRIGAGVEVDYTDGKMIVSRTNGDRAVAVSADSTQVIGVNPDGSYDFNRHFRHANPSNELKGFADSALFQFARPWGIKESFTVPNDVYYKHGLK